MTGAPKSAVLGTSPTLKHRPNLRPDSEPVLAAIRAS
jgi:hypothetical protein